MPESLHVGVLIVPPVQLLDVSPVDLFSMADKEYLTICGLPPAICALGLHVRITYISPVPGANLAECTASAALRINVHIEDPSVAPGKLDVLLIPGPPPDMVPDEATRAFVKAHAAEEQKTTVMTVCTGVYVAGYADVLDGKQVTGPRALVPRLEKLFPKAKFVDQRWSVDGNVWSSGGITNGQDMVAAYLRQRWPGPMSNMVCAMADVGERGQAYGGSRTAETAWVVWQIVRALFTRSERD